MIASQTRAGQVSPGRLFRFPRSVAMTLLVVLLCVGLLLLPHLSTLLTWHRIEPVGLEIWSSHFVHWSGGHLLWDLLVFTVTGCILERSDRSLFAMLLAIAPPAIIGATWLFESHANYRGLSGLDCALYSALLMVARNRNWISGKVAIGFFGLLLGKCILEITSGSALFVSDLPDNITSVPWAHLSGAAVGVIIAMVRERTVLQVQPLVKVSDRALKATCPSSIHG